MRDDREMPKKINYQLTEEELLLVEQAIKNHPDLRVRWRAQIIRLLHLGHNAPSIAELLSISTGQPYYWHKRWREKGLDGLRDEPRPGRPPVATDLYVAKLEEAIAQNPTDLGYAFQVWTAPRLIAYLAQETGITLALTTFFELLKRHHYVYRRPKHDLGNLQNKKAKAQAVETIEMLKKRQKQELSNYSLWMKQP
jgi:transposase